MSHPNPAMRLRDLEAAVAGEEWIVREFETYSGQLHVEIVTSGTRVDGSETWFEARGRRIEDMRADARFAVESRNLLRQFFDRLDTAEELIEAGRELGLIPVDQFPEPRLPSPGTMAVHKRYRNAMEAFLAARGPSNPTKRSLGSRACGDSASRTVWGSPTAH